MRSWSPRVRQAPCVAEAAHGCFLVSTADPAPVGMMSSMPSMWVAALPGSSNCRGWSLFTLPTSSTKDSKRLEIWKQEAAVTAHQPIKHKNKEAAGNTNQMPRMLPLDMFKGYTPLHGQSQPTEPQRPTNIQGSNHNHNLVAPTG